MKNELKGNLLKVYEAITDATIVESLEENSNRENISHYASGN